MVFFCIPKVDSSIKNVPKKKLNIKDIKDNHIQKEIEIVNQTNLETYCVNQLNSFVFEKNNTNNSVIINSPIGESKEIKNEMNFMPATVTVNGVLESDYKCEPNEISNKVEVILNNQSLLMNNNFSENVSLTNDMHKNSSDELNIHLIKTEFIDNSGTLKKEKQCSFQNISTKSSYNHFPATGANKLLLDKNIATKCEAIDNLSECYTKEIKTKFINDSDISKSDMQNNFQNTSTNFTNEHHFSTTDTNKLFLDENVIVKSEATENLSECSTDVNKRNSHESVKQLINKWTIDEDKIILQTCKRVEDIEVLLETINRRIPQRSVSEVKFVYFCNIIIKLIHNLI